MYYYDMYHTAMNRFKYPLIDWLIENEDIPYNLASSSIPDYELSVSCSIHKNKLLGHDHELEEEFIGLISSFYEDDIRLTFGEDPDIIKTGLEKLSKVIDVCR